MSKITFISLFIFSTVLNPFIYKSQDTGPQIREQMSGPEIS